MPTYLIHGFRWHRQNIRVHIVINDLEDATPEWVLAPATSMSILNSFYTNYDFLPPSNPPPLAYAHIPIPPVPDDDLPDDDQLEERPQTAKVKKSRSMVSLRSRSRSRKSKRPAELVPPVNGYGHGYSHAYEQRKISTSGSDHRPRTTSGSSHGQSKPEKKWGFNDWSVVKLLEQYDPSDMKAVSQPFAYVADYMVEVSLGVAITEEMAKYEAKMRGEDGPMSPVTPSTSGVYASGDPTNEDPHRTESMSIRDMRRKSRRFGWLGKLRDGLQKGEDIGWHIVVCGDEERASPSTERIRGRLGNDDEDQQLRTPRSAGFKGLFRKRSVQNQ